MNETDKISYNGSVESGKGVQNSSIEDKLNINDKKRTFSVKEGTLESELESFSKKIDEISVNSNTSGGNNISQSGTIDAEKSTNNSSIERTGQESDIIKENETRQDNNPDCNTEETYNKAEVDSNSKSVDTYKSKGDEKLSFESNTREGSYSHKSYSGVSYGSEANEAESRTRNSGEDEEVKEKFSVESTDNDNMNKTHSIDQATGENISTSNVDASVDGIPRPVIPDSKDSGTATANESKSKQLGTPTDDISEKLVSTQESTKSASNRELSRDPPSPKLRIPLDNEPVRPVTNINIKRSPGSVKNALLSQNNALYNKTHGNINISPMGSEQSPIHIQKRNDLGKVDTNGNTRPANFETSEPSASIRKANNNDINKPTIRHAPVLSPNSRMAIVDGQSNKKNSNDKQHINDTFKTDGNSFGNQKLNSKIPDSPNEKSLESLSSLDLSYNRENDQVDDYQDNPHFDPTSLTYVVSCCSQLMDGAVVNCSSFESYDLTCIPPLADIFYDIIYKPVLKDLPKLPFNSQTPIKMEDVWMCDKDIGDFILRNKARHSFWKSNLLVSIVKYHNLLYSPLARAYSIKFRDSIPFLGVFTEKCNCLILKNARNATVQKKKTNKPLYFDDASLSNGFDKENYTNSTLGHLNGKDKNRNPYDVDNPEQIARGVQNLLKIKLKANGNKELLEPFYCSSYLFRSGYIVSDIWNTISDASAKKLGIDSKNNYAYFELCTDKIGPFERCDLSRLYYVIELRRCLYVGNGEDINAYYLDSGSTKKKQKAESAFNASFPRNKNIFSTFGIISISIQELVSQKSIKCTPYLCSKDLSAAFITEISEKRRTLPGKAPITIELSAEYINDSATIDYIKERIIKSVYVSNEECSNRFSNSIRFGIKRIVVNSNKDLKANNIFSKIQLCVSDNKPLKSIRDPFSGKFTDTATTITMYHNKSPQYIEHFVADLPYPLPSGLSFKFEIRSGHAKQCDVNSTLIKEVIIPITDENGNFKGVRLDKTNWLVYKVNFDLNTSESNFIEFKYQVDSIFYSIDKNIQQFLLQINANRIPNFNLLSNANPEFLYLNFILLFESIIDCLLVSPYYSVYSIVKLFRPLNMEKGLSFRRKAYKLVLYHSLKLHSLVDLEKIAPYILASFASYFKTSEFKENIVNDICVIDSCLTLAVKSLCLCCNKNYTHSFEEFTRSLLDAIYERRGVDHTELVKVYARFTDQIFELGGYSCLSVIVKYMRPRDDSRQSAEVLGLLIRYLFSPKAFIVNTLNSDSFSGDFLSILVHIIRVENGNFIRTFNDVCFVFSDINSFVVEVCTKFTDIIFEFAASKLQFNEELMPVLIFLVHIMYNCDKKVFCATYIKRNDVHSTLFNFISRFLILTRPQNEGGTGPAKRSAIFDTLVQAVVQILELCKELDYDVKSVSEVYYHLFCITLPVSTVGPLVASFTSYVTSNIADAFVNFHTALPRYISKILHYSRFKKVPVIKFLNKLVKADGKKHGNTNRSLSVICRAVTYLKHEKRSDLSKLCNTDKKLNSSVVSILKPIAKSAESSLKSVYSCDEKANDIFENVLALSWSPDAVIDESRALMVLYKENKDRYANQALCVRLFQIVVIFTFYSFTQGQAQLGSKSINDFKYFQDLIPCIEPIYQNKQLFSDVPKIPSFCDSKWFSEKYLISTIGKFQTCATQCKLYELGYIVIDMIWSLLEGYKMFGAISEFCKTQQDLCKSIEKNENRLVLEKYYYVTYTGPLFKDLNGSITILTGQLEDSVQHVLDRYVPVLKNRFGKAAEVFKPEKKYTHKDSYYMITEVFPVRKRRKEEKTYVSQYHNIYKFEHKEEFQKNGNGPKWVKRVCITLKYPLPSVVAFCDVPKSGVVEKIISPLKISYKQIKETNEELSHAMETNDFEMVGIILESLLCKKEPDVLSIARTFISKSFPPDYDDMKFTTKNKLIEKLNELIKLCNSAIVKYTQSHYKTAKDIQNFGDYLNILSNNLTSILPTKK